MRKLEDRRRHLPLNVRSATKPRGAAGFVRIAAAHFFKPLIAPVIPEDRRFDYAPPFSGSQMVLMNNLR
jgi:hypothetical protein